MEKVSHVFLYAYFLKKTCLFELAPRYVKKKKNRMVTKKKKNDKENVGRMD